KELEGYLTELAITDRVDLISIERDKVLIRLHTAGDLALLQNMLELGKKLYPVISNSVLLQHVQPYMPGTPSTGNWQSTGIEGSESPTASLTSSITSTSPQGT